MIRSWLIWLVVTVIVALYICAGAVESSTKRVNITLKPGYSTQVRIFRLAENRLQMRLNFQGDHRRRPELCTYSARSDFDLLPNFHPVTVRVSAVCTPLGAG